MKKEFFLKTILLFLLPVILYSCKEDTIEPTLYGSISGVVTDAVTGQAISGASISTNPPTDAIATDSNGKYKINDIPIGNYAITIKKSGYVKINLSISVKDNLISSANVQLEKEVLANNPPLTPFNPYPSINLINQPITLKIAWQALDPDSLDKLFYDVYFYESNSLTQTLIAENYEDTTLTVSDLNYNTVYYWQVVVKDTAKHEIKGDVWNFKTRDFPDNPIVFAAEVDGNYEIFSTDGNDSNTVRLTYNPTREWWPRISPKRDKIAFTSDKNVEPQIFTMNRDGSNITQITQEAITGYNNYGIGFSWSPNGEKIIYAHYNTLYRIDSDGRNLTAIAKSPEGRNFRECDWSPLGDKIVVLTMGENEYDSEIYIMNSDGSNMTKIVDNLPGKIESPAFSLDGKNIIFTHDESGYEAGGRQLNSHIYSIDLSGNGLTDISLRKLTGTNDCNPRYSRNGAKIIFTNSSNDNSQPKQIWIMDTNGENREQLIPSGDMPEWK